MQVQGLVFKMGKCVSGQAAGVCVAAEAVAGTVSQLHPAAGAPQSGKKRVLFVRHGQGLHNTSLAGWQLCDPPLTAVGVKQVAALNVRLQPHLSELEVVVVSPLIRAMQTATGGLDGTEVCVLASSLLISCVSCCHAPSLSI